MEKAPKGQLVVIRQELYTYPVTVLEHPKWHHRHVYVNDIDVGRVWINPANREEYVYPPEVSLIYVRYDDQRFTSAGRQVDVMDLASLPIPYSRRVDLRNGLDSAGSRPEGRRRVDRGLWRQTAISLCGVSYTYQTAQQLTIGQVLATDIDTPFHWTSPAKTQLTNAPTWPTLVIPAQRPSGANWRDREDIVFLQGISSANWPLLLQAIEDRYLDEILSWKGHLPSVSTLRSLIRTNQQTYFDETTRPAIGQCFAEADAHYVAIGENLLFTIEHDGRVVYLVDSPEYGRAIYLFLAHEPALQWAERTIDYHTARASAFTYFNHTGAWNEVIRAAIEAAFAQLATESTS